jgi:putative intracellular protease/amidase
LGAIEEASGPIVWHRTRATTVSRFRRPVWSTDDGRSRHPRTRDATTHRPVRTLKEKVGVEFSRGEIWKPYIVEDRNLITGQNPHSAAVLAERLLKVLA